MYLHIFFFYQQLTFKFQALVLNLKFDKVNNYLSSILAYQNLTVGKA